MELCSGFCGRPVFNPSTELVRGVRSAAGATVSPVRPAPLRAKLARERGG